MDYISQNLWLFWTVIMFICLILELSSGDFYVTCFAIGALISIPVADRKSTRLNSSHHG